MAIVQHTRLNDIGRGTPSSQLETIHRFRQRRVWHVIISLGQHTRSDDSGRGILSSPLDCTYDQKTLGFAMLSSPLGNIHSQTTSCVKFPYCPLDITHGQMTSMWHAIIAFGLHTRKYDVGSGMTSSNLCSTHDRMTLAVVMPSSPLECTQEPMTLGVKCYYHPRTGNTIR